MLHRRPPNPAASTFPPDGALTRNALARLRPGAILAMAVITVVGVFGIVEWNQRLILTGLIAGLAIIAINVVVVTTQYWHRRNTRLEATYIGAEEVVRQRTPRPR